MILYFLVMVRELKIIDLESINWDGKTRITYADLTAKIEATVVKNEFAVRLL